MSLVLQVPLLLSARACMCLDCLYSQYACAASPELLLRHRPASAASRDSTHD
jgi:hypothetical protein